MGDYYGQERRDFSSSTYNRRGGGGGRGRGGGGGGNNRRNDRRDYHGQGGGGGGNYHGGYGRGGGGNRGGRRYGGGGGGGRGGATFGGRGPRRRTGNRFSAEGPPPDAQQAFVQNLLNMVNKVGLVQPPLPKSEDDTAAPDSNAVTSTRPAVRAVMATQAANIQALTNVICGSNAETFFTFQRDAFAADQRAGALASGVVHAAAVWPLQTPCYAALTLGLYAASSDSLPPSFAGFHQRCVEYAVLFLAREIDGLLLTCAAWESHDKSSPAAQPRYSCMNVLERSHACVRARLMLRYLIKLAQLNIIVAQEAEELPIVPSAIQHVPVTMSGLLQALVQAAQQARERHDNPTAAFTLALLAAHCVPHLTTLFSIEWIKENITEPLQEIVDASYVSAFAPGIGNAAILLKQELVEEGNELAEGDEEDDDVDTDDTTGQVCDTLQDVMRSNQFVLQKKDGRFALFTDAPWQALEVPRGSDQPPKQPFANTTTIEEGTESLTVDEDQSKHSLEKLTFRGESLKLKMFPACQSLSLLLGSEVDATTKLVRHRNLSGIVFGRLPIFGPPPEAAEDEEDDDEEKMEHEAPANDRFAAYQKRFGMVDRFFIGEAIRDMLLTLESNVSESGIEQGSNKAVAEQVLLIRYMMLESTDEESKEDPAKGIEYAIVETIISLIVQASLVSPFRFMYLSRVLLELTRLEPTILSPAIALGVGTLFQDYLPALAPAARHNLSRWFAYHMTNTDYQWPEGYWKHWEPFAKYGWQNSRGSFVKVCLAFLTENVSDPGQLAIDCLPKDSLLIDHLVPDVPNIPYTDDSAFASLEREIRMRLWENGEDAKLLLLYLVGEETSETIAGEANNNNPNDGGRIWWRTRAMVRSILFPVTEEHSVLKTSLKRVKNEDDGSMNIEISFDDVMAKVLDMLQQYREVLLGVMKKDVGDSQESLEDVLLYVIGQVYDMTIYSRSLFESCITCLINHDVISPSSVIRWSLGENGHGDGQSWSVLRWWECASIAALYSATNPKFFESVMDDEDKETTPSSIVLKKTKTFLEYFAPLFTYIIRRLCTMMSQNDFGSKMSSKEIDLIEGVKYFHHQISAIYFGIFEVECQQHECEFRETYSHSPISGPLLAQLVPHASGISALDFLRKVLDRL